MFPTSAAVTVGPNGTLTYAPSSVDIAAGGTVTWTWAGGIAHSVTSDTGVFNSGIMTGGTFSFTFPTAGTFHYHCLVHGFIMAGTIVVH
jgi:plastocyanin